jgi:hypothetical protein
VFFSSKISPDNWSFLLMVLIDVLMSFSWSKTYFFFCSLCSKAILMFEDDERFKAVERPREREDLFENYLVELHKKVIRY